MKYQITCDNCGTQFIVEAEEGQTIECKCPHCQGIIEVTLPLVSAGQQYEQQPVHDLQAQQETAESSGGNRRAVGWGVIIGLLLLSVGVGAYMGFRSSPSDTPAIDTIPNDTIPYEQPITQEPDLQVDTAVSAPVETAPQEQEMIEEAPEEEADSTAADGYTE